MCIRRYHDQGRHREHQGTSPGAGPPGALPDPRTPGGSCGRIGIDPSSAGSRQLDGLCRRGHAGHLSQRIVRHVPAGEGKYLIMATVTFDHASRTYPCTERPAVDALDLHILDGEFLVLVGPSGCGKSTSLRMLAGLEDLNSGRVLIGERDVTNVQPKDRDIAMVFQNYALYPHMSVADNMGFALKIASVPKADIRKRVLEAAKLLDLEPYLERKPARLSGGQRQRVAMGRAIVRSPQVFLMDEPLSNLDAKLRVQTRTQIASLQRRLGVTTVYVTHDQTEAMTMGDRIAVLKDGLLQQVGDPRDLYDQPVNVFVGGFIGSPAMNIGSFRVVGDGAQLANTRIPLDRGVLSKITDEDKGRITIGFRPESLNIVSQADDGAIPIKVVLIEELGADALAYGELALEGEAKKEISSGAGEGEIIVRVDPRNVPRKGDTVWVSIRAGELHCFSPSTGERLNT